MKKIITSGVVIAAIALTGCGGSGGSSTSTTPTAEKIAARMHISHPIFAYNAETDPNKLMGRQGGYASKVNWGAGTADDSHSSIEVFPTKADMVARASYLSSFDSTFIGDGYDYQNGSALLRLSRDYTPTQAKSMKADFDAAVAAS